MLSDKTGTLTQNVMGFVWASIGGAMYGQMQHAQQAVQHAALQQQQRRRRQAAAAAAASGSNGSNGDPSSKVLLDPQQSAGVGGVGAAAAGVTGGSSKGSAAAARVTSPQMMGSGGGVVIAGSARDGPPPNTPHTIALDPELRQAAMAAVGCYAGSSGSDGGSGAAAAAAAVQDFLLALAVCNTVVPTATDQGYLLYQVRCSIRRNTSAAMAASIIFRHSSTRHPHPSYVHWSTLAFVWYHSVPAHTHMPNHTL